MRFSLKSITAFGGIAALSLGLIACHGQYPGGTAYMPASTSAAVPPGGGIDTTGKKSKIKIQSSCGHHLHIVLAGIVNCKFREKRYQNGTFAVTDNEQGIIEVAPQSGTRSTVFTVVGLVLGSGDLVWKDTKGHQYKIAVSVTL